MRPRASLVALLMMVVSPVAALPLPSTKVQFAAPGAPTVDAEVARSPHSLARGLMFRRTLGANAGMLFVFETAAPRSFWMRNTPLPLDMVFIDASCKVVRVVQGAEPLTTTAYGGGVPAQYVLEVNAGWTERFHIVAGTRVDLGDLTAR